MLVERCVTSILHLATISFRILIALSLTIKCHHPHEPRSRSNWWIDHGKDSRDPPPPSSDDAAVVAEVGVISGHAPRRRTSDAPVQVVAAPHPPDDADAVVVVVDGNLLIYPHTDLLTYPPTYPPTGPF